MTAVEWLSVARAVIALVCIPYAIRADMRFLTAGWVAALVASVSLASGVALVIVGVIALPLYVLWAVHTLYVTRRKRDQPYFPRRTSG